MTQHIPIIRATSPHIPSLIQFQLNLAKQTQDKDLHHQIISKGIQHLVESLTNEFYLVALIDNEVVGCIMTNLQNSERAWIQSVYVSKAHRMKGIFRKLFDSLCDIHRKNGIKRVYLYAEEENGKALATYKKLGMDVLDGVSMYGFDFVYGKEELPKVTKQYNKKPVAISGEETKGLIDILKSDSSNHVPISIYNEDTLVGYLEYFEEFSDWRYGRTINIMTLLVKGGEGKEVMAWVLDYFKNHLGGLDVNAIRFFVGGEGEGRLKELVEIPRLHYYVLGADL